MPLDIDSEGSAESLSWKRAEVSSFRKQILGSSPKEAGSSQIETASERAEAQLRYNVKCPECGEHSPLEFGGRDSGHGFKWEKDKPETVLYHCRECGSGWPNSKLHAASVAGFWYDPASGYSTRDGLVWRKNGEPCNAPRHVAFRVWSAYSPFTTWSEIISEWIRAQGDPLELKTFVNTTLGETWEAQEGDTIKPAKLEARDRDEMPDDIVLVTAGVDVQPDRFEVQYLGHSANGNMTVVGYEIVPAETDLLDNWKERLTPRLEKEFMIGGRPLKVEAAGVDTGGSATMTAYDYCALNAEKHVLALKGAAGDRPVIPLKPSRNWRKVGLNGWLVGVNAAKDVIMTAIAKEDGVGRLLFPSEVELPQDYFKQLLAERRVLKIVNGKRTYLYQKRSASARNEALDVTVYGIAAARWLMVHRRVDLQQREQDGDDTDTGFDMF